MNPHKPNIVVGIDFSPCSEQALTTAMAMAQRLNVALHVVHVFEPLALLAGEAQHRYVDVEARLEQEKLRQRELCVELCNRLIGDRVPFEVHVFVAMAIDGLLESIARLKPEFIVVGSHGRGALKRLLLGSVSAAICRRSSVPVVVVPDSEQANAQILQQS